MYYVYINHDPVMTLAYFRGRSPWFAYAFEWVKLLKCRLKGKTCRKLANGQDIDYSEKKNGPRASSVPFHNIQEWLLVYTADLM